MKVAVLQYNAGNVCSVMGALRRVGVEALLTSSPDEIRSADRVIFPGQGEAATTMRHLRETGLDRIIAGLTQPVLGICIGQQLLCAHSEEGNTDCLNLFPEIPVKKFVAKKEFAMKVPHMGWNTLEQAKTSLFQSVKDDSYVYFVHSYYVPVCPWTIAETQYGDVRFSAAMRRGNFFATQFHPEKSGAVGEKILTNFLDLEL